MKKNNNIDYIEIKNMVINAIENNELEFYPVEYKKWKNEVRSKVGVYLDIEGRTLMIETDNTYKFYDWDEIEDAFCDEDEWTTSDILETMNDRWETEWYITRDENEAGFGGDGEYFYASDKFIEEVVNLLLNDLIRARRLTIKPIEWEEMTNMA